MIIAVDFDGTIVENAYPKIGRERPFAISTLIKLQTEGHHQLILWSCRQGEQLDEAVEFCRQRGLEFYAVNSNYPEEQPEHKASRKIDANLFIDDHNLGGLPDWGVIYQQIMNGKIFEPYQAEIKSERSKPSLLKRLFG